MANEQIVQSAGLDTIAVFNGFDQVFENARPLRDDVIPRSKVMDHPLETGQIVSDYKITLPTEIIIVFIVSISYYRDTYQEIWNLWQQSTLLTVQTRVASFGNMIIAEQPHEENSEMFDAIKITLKFRQVLTPSQAPNFQPADPTQANTQSIGQQAPTTTTVSGGATGSW